MQDEPRFGYRSTLAIAGHPLHPLLVTLPIGFLVGALLSDLAFYATGDLFWARASEWLVGGGLASGALAAVAGLIDFFGNDRIRALGIAWFHFLGNAVALVLSAINLYLRVQPGTHAVTHIELSLSVVVVLIFAITGWLGGELVFRHGVGITKTDNRPGRSSDINY